MTAQGELNIESLLADAENPAYRLAVTARILVGSAVALIDEHAELDRAAAQALVDDTANVESLDWERRAPAAAQAVADKEAQIEAAKVSFRFVSVGRRAWADLVSQHPPTKDDLKRDARSDINARTFPIAAIAASCTSPKMEPDDVARLEAVVTDSQWQALWNACLEANLGGLATPKSVVAGSILRANERSATTAANAGSPDPGSLDE